MKKTMMNRENLERLYWEEEKSSLEIAEEFGFKSRTSILRRMKEWGIPTRSHSQAISLAHNKGKLDPSHPKKVDFTEEEALSYILGVLIGDGGTHKSRKGEFLVELNQTRKKFAQSFKKALEKIGLNPGVYGPYQPKDEGHSPLYMTKAHSKLLVEWFEQFDLGKIFEYVVKDLANAREFIRGIYESEGSNVISSSWRLTIVSTERKKLEIVDRVLNRIGFKFRFKEVNSRRSWRGMDGGYYLEITEREQILRFLREIKPCIKNSIHPNALHPLRQKWTESEDSKLEREYKRKTAREISDELDRSLDSVQSRVRDLGLKK